MPDHCVEHNRLAVDTQVALQSIQRDLGPIKSTLEALTTLMRDSNTADIGREKLAAEYNHQVLEDLRAIQGVVDDISDDIRELSQAAKMFESIEETSDLTNKTTTENNTLLRKLTGIHEEKPILPTLETIGEICRNSRISAGRDPETGEPLTGMQKISCSINNAFWQWMGLIVMLLVYLLLRPYIPGWLSGIGKP